MFNASYRCKAFLLTHDDRWNLGQVIVALLSWLYLSKYACSGDADCTMGDNMGW
jgi:hypothetical protein